MIGDHGFVVRDREVKLHRWPHLQFHIYFKWNIDCVSAINGQFPDFTTIRSNHKFAVGCKRKSRVYTQWRDGFLLVALHRISQPGLLTRLDVAFDQPSLFVEAGAVYQPIAISRKGRGKSRTDALGAGFDLPGFAVKSSQLVLGQNGVVVPGSCAS